MGRLMSDAEVRRRKKAQGHISQATGALGLAALGGTLAASRGGRNTLRKIPQLKTKIKAPPKKDPERDKIKGAVTPILAASAGLGGAGAFNFASYTNAESRKRKSMTPVGKRDWSPTARHFDSEANRQKRADVYPAIAAGGATAAATGAGVTAAQGHKLKGAADTAQKKKKAYKQLRVGSKAKFKTSGKLGAAGAALGAGAVALNQRRKSDSWSVYKSSEVEPMFSEIGKSEDYLEEISKIGEWKTIDQREATQRRDRKGMRAAGAGAGVGAGLMALGYHDAGDKPKYKSTGATLRDINANRKVGNLSNKESAKFAGKALKMGGSHLSASGKIGAGMVGAAAAVGAGAKAQHTYQQHKVNERRRHNFKKSAFGVEHD